MCGICGVVDKKYVKPFSSDIVGKMVEKLGHRGPDMTNIYTCENVTLGFVRLSIIDLQFGIQPMFNEDKSVISICNGEIYNYKELQQELIMKGHVFRTHCDVEIIVHLYEEYGISFLEYLNGQFAIALYDIKTKKMYCARDQVGIAPLFYTKVDGTFIFASEIKALFEYPGVRKEIDLVSMDQVFSFPGHMSPKSMFKGIKSIENGHYIEINSDGITDREFWDLNYKQIDVIENESYYIEKLDEILTQAVRYRLNADVPVGFYISGGLDSSIIAAKINMLGRDILRHSFSIDFAQSDISENKFQKMVLNSIQSIHHEKKFTSEDIFKRLKSAVYYSESMLKETYNTASLQLSELVKEADIKVVLTGEGADELFGGYVGYKFDKMRLMYNLSGADSSLTKEDKEINERLWGDPYFTYEKNHGQYNEIKKSIYSHRLLQRFDEFDCTKHPFINMDKLNKMDLLQKRSYLDFKIRLSDHLLSDHGDRMAYANSVEARYPFLDKNVVEFAAQIPTNLKLKEYEEKYILKKIANGIVPNEIIRRPKFAFVAPGSPELIKKDFEYVNDILSYETIKKQGFFNPDEVERLKKIYKQDNFKLNLPYDTDLLIMVITFGILMDVYKISNY